MATNQYLTHAITAGATAVIAIVAVVALFNPDNSLENIDIKIYIDQQSSLFDGKLDNTKIGTDDPITTVSIIQQTLERTDIEDPLSYITTNILTKDQDNAQGWEYVGDVQFEKEEFIDALASYNIADSKQPNNPQILNKIGSTYFVGGDGMSALNFYERALSINNAYSPALNNAAFLHALHGDNEKALDYFERGLNINPNHGPLLSNYALFLALSGNYEESKEKYNKISILYPDLPELLINEKVVEILNNKNLLVPDQDIAKLLKELGLDLELSIAFFDGDILRGVKTNISFAGNFEDVDQMVAYGNKLQIAKLYKLSEWYFLKSLEKSPENLNAQVGLAYTYDLANLLDESLDGYNVVLEKHPDHIGANNGMGNVYLKLGDYEAANQYYMKVLEKHSDDINARLGLGNVQLAQSNYRAALEYYNIVLDDTPDHINANKAAALANFLSKNYGESKNYYENVLELTGGHDIDSLWGLGISLRFLGDLDESSYYLEQYRTYNTDIVEQLKEILLSYPKDSELAMELRATIDSFK